ncbi:MAG: PepSY domain-containing protein [Clostridia bacterium]|nr:PepSY domain-containing protein [Clostridia bacterium]
MKKRFAPTLLLACLFALCLITGAWAESALTAIMPQNAEACLSAIVEDAQPDRTVMASAMRAAAVSGNSIVFNGARDYSFPGREVEHADISSKATLLQNGDDAVWVIALFPQDIGQMAAAVLVDATTHDVLDLYEDSTWAMEQEWAQALGEQIYFWPLEARSLFHRLYEAEDVVFADVMPDAASIPQEEALAIAAGAMEAYGCQPDDYRTGADFCRTAFFGEDVPLIWSINYYTGPGDDLQLQYTVYIDAATGTVLDLADNNQGLG